MLCGVSDGDAFVMALGKLDSIAPRFWVPPGRVRVLSTPAEFYKYLCERIDKARSRVFLATLYIGRSEHQLVAKLAARLESNKDLKVEILSDALRGTREAPHDSCTASLLSPLVNEFPGRVTVHQWQTPRRIAKWLPKRFNEGVGLQHMKIYGFDDELVLSGANLSHDYFTNRQDRYISIRDSSVTDHFYKIFSAISQLSWRVLPHRGPNGPNDNFRHVWPEGTPPLGTSAYFKKAQQLLSPLLKPGIRAPSNEGGTFIYPLAQFGPVKAGGTELVALESVLSRMEQPWVLTAGYFNIHPTLQKCISQTSQPGLVITASEQANGFYMSKGLSGRIPRAYTILTRKFLRECESSGAPVGLREWRHGTVNQPDGWSYHAKGLWLHGLTYIGSSNFTRRAYKHDLEAGCILKSEDPQLIHDLQKEVDGLKHNLGPALSTRDLPSGSVSDRVLVTLLGTRL